MFREMNKKKLKILHILDTMIRRQSARIIIDSIIPLVEQRLTQDPKILLAWEPVPLPTYGEGLPDIIRSSWVFVLRAQTTTGAERHPNSYQHLISYRGSGDLRILNDELWGSNLLASDPSARIENRSLSIPPNIWHRALVPEENWVVVSFHTVYENELIEERLDETDAELVHQRRYTDELE